MEFTIEQVKALCGGKLPGEGSHLANGFAWSTVEYFKLEGGVLEPYAGDTILPGPGIRVAVSLVGL